MNIPPFCSDQIDLNYSGDWIHSWFATQYECCCSTEHEFYGSNSFTSVFNLLHAPQYIISFQTMDREITNGWNPVEVDANKAIEIARNNLCPNSHIVEVVSFSNIIEIWILTVNVSYQKTLSGFTLIQLIGD